MITGIEHANGGETIIGDKVVDSITQGLYVPPEQRGIGLVFQSYALWPHMTVEQNVDFGLRLQKVPAQAHIARTQDVMEKLRIANYAKRYPAQLSGGQQQRADSMPLANEAVTPAPVTPATPVYPRPPISLISENFPGWGMDISIDGASGVCDAALLAEHDIGIVINCAVNLDIDWVATQEATPDTPLLCHGAGPVHYYKLGLIDGEGNAREMLHAAIT